MKSLLNKQAKKLPFTVFLRQVLIGLSLLGLGSVASYSYSSWHQERQNLLDQLSIQAEFMATSSQAVFDNIGSNLLRIGDRIKAGDRLDQLGPLFAEIKQRNPEIGSIFIYDSTGRALIDYTDRLGHPNYRISQSPERIADFNAAVASRQPYTVDKTEYGIIVKRWRMTIRSTVRVSPGHPIYVISASIPVAHQTSLWSHLPLLPASSIGLLRDDYYLQARWPETGPQQLYATQIRKNSPLISEMQRLPKSGTFEGLISVANQYRIGAYASLAHSPLTAFISVPRQLIWQNWLRHNMPLFLLFGLSIVAFFGFCLMLLKRETQHSATLLKQARTDELTGLPNRKAATEFFKHKLALAEEYGIPFAVMLLDLDRFKAINDTRGHDYGDQVLKEVARRLNKELREGDFLARLGGDEFFALIDCSATNKAQSAAERLMATMAEPFIVKDETFDLSLSIGISMYPDSGSEAKELLKQADSAMYEVKRAGREGFAVFK